MQQAHEEEDSDFVYVDDDGNVVSPSAEASCIAAASFGDALETHDTDEWYLQGMRECADMRARLDAYDPCTAEAGSGSSDDDGSDANGDCAQGAEPGATDADAGSGAAGEGGMGDGEGWSREHSDAAEADEWVLESLIKRRRLKAAVRSYDDGGEASVAPHEYLCKWKWYREPTWELRATLEELGYVARLAEFDARRAPMKPQRKPVGSQRRHKAIALGDLEALMGESFAARVFAKVKESHLEVVRYSAVNNNTIERRFLARWKENAATHCPMILFHGTRRCNIESIASRGLIVPNSGSGVRVVNGSAYGVGIYAAKNAGYSRSYTQGCPLMFVCVALVGPQYTTMKESGDICVFFDSSLIVPLWLIEFQPLAANGASAVVGDPTRVPFATITRPSRVPPPFHGVVCPNHSGAAESRRCSKKMIRQMPRYVKDLYKQGALLSKRGSK